MKPTRTLISRLVGGIQCTLGGIASVFAYLAYASPATRAELGITEGEVSLFILVFLIFSVVSILSGIILVRDES